MNIEYVEDLDEEDEEDLEQDMEGMYCQRMICTPTVNYLL